MKRRTLVIFGIITLLVFGIAWVGKQHFPQWFGKAWVQYGSAAFTALACPIGALFALKLMHEGDRRSGCGLLLLFCAPVVVTLAMQGIGGPLAGRLHGSTHPTRNQFGAIARASEFCITPEVDPAKRMENAAFVYRVWGIKLPVMHKDGSIALFIPHGDDEEGVAQTVQTWRMADQTESLLDDQLRQMPWLFGLYLGSWCAVFAVGLGWFAFRGRRGVATAV